MNVAPTPLPLHGLCMRADMTAGHFKPVLMDSLRCELSSAKRSMLAANLMGLHLRPWLCMRSTQDCWLWLFKPLLRYSPG